MSLKISDDYLIGFIEGEGTFYIGIVPSKETNSHWQVIYFFKVSQNPVGIEVLKAIRKRLGCGYIRENDKNRLNDKTYVYVIRDLQSIKCKVIPFLDNKLIVKKDNFEKFKKVVEMVSEKKHLRFSGIKRIIDIAYSMNTGKRRVPKEKILSDYIK